MADDYMPKITINLRQLEAMLISFGLTLHATLGDAENEDFSKTAKDEAHRYITRKFFYW